MPKRARHARTRHRGHFRAQRGWVHRWRDVCRLWVRKVRPFGQDDARACARDCLALQGRVTTPAGQGVATAWLRGVHGGVARLLQKRLDREANGLTTDGSSTAACTSAAQRRVWNGTATCSPFGLGADRDEAVARQGRAVPSGCADVDVRAQVRRRSSALARPCWASGAAAVSSLAVAPPRLGAPPRLHRRRRWPSCLMRRRGGPKLPGQRRSGVVPPPWAW
jgi:hypothetical protein